MIVYRDKTAEVSLQHDFDKPLVANVYRYGQQLGAINRPVVSIAGIHTTEIDYTDTEFDGELQIVWSGDGFTRKTQVTVATPIVPFPRLATVFPDRFNDEEFFNELESSVRLIIEAYTGTKFEYFRGTVNVHASNNALMLPTRAMEIYEIPGLPSFNVSPNGRVVIGTKDEYLTIKQAPPEEFTYVTHGVIHVPGYYRKIRTGNIYAVSGEFGYLEVPEDVQEAAMLLANDFACNDGIYRDKYIETVKTELTNYVFNDRAFSGTGNAKADLLLSKYKVEGYAWL